MFRIRLAGITVEIDNRHNLVFEQCKDYLCDDCAPAFRVAVSTAETQAYQASCGRPMTLPEAESYLLYRRICERMPRYGVFLLHAAVVETMGTVDRGVKTRTYPDQPGINYYGVLRHSAAYGCPTAFIIEHGFHTNPEDAAFLSSDECLDKLAQAEAEAIDKAL